jgi:hypothetical protein
MTEWTTPVCALLLAKRAARAGAKFFLRGAKVLEAVVGLVNAAVRRDRATPLLRESLRQPSKSLRLKLLEL